MRKPDFKFILAAVVLYSMTLAATAKAAPVQFNQVVQVVNAKPGKANTSSFARLRLTDGDGLAASDGDGDKKTDAPQQDNRVISETKTEIVEDDVCDCVEATVVGGGFPYGWLALGAIPLLFLIPHDDDVPPQEGFTPTPTPPTTPTMTPTPPTEPVPEPMTILLFGTGLAGVGLAARRRFGKRNEETKE